MCRVIATTVSGDVCRLEKSQSGFDIAQNRL
jgi:hypothetical protein